MKQCYPPLIGWLANQQQIMREVVGEKGKDEGERIKAHNKLKHEAGRMIAKAASPISLSGCSSKVNDGDK